MDLRTTSNYFQQVASLPLYLNVRPFQGGLLPWNGGPADRSFAKP